MPEMDTLIEAIAAQWTEVGVNVTIKKVAAEDNRESYRAREPMPFIFPTRSVPQVQPVPNNFGLFYGTDSTFGGVGDKTVDGMLAQFETLPVDEWPANFAKISQRIYDEHLTIPLVGVKPTVAFDPKVVEDWVGVFGFGFDGLTTLKAAE